MLPYSGLDLVRRTSACKQGLPRSEKKKRADPRRFLEARHPHAFVSPKRLDNELRRQPIHGLEPSLVGPGTNKRDMVGRLHMWSESLLIRSIPLEGAISLASESASLPFYHDHQQSHPSSTGLDYSQDDWHLAPVVQVNCRSDFPKPAE